MLWGGAQGIRRFKNQLQEAREGKKLKLSL
jgi:hypothetical protein